jgi:Flp pilus assembly protein TadD
MRDVRRLAAGLAGARTPRAFGALRGRWAALLAAALWLPGCAWFGPSAAQREVIEARRARTSAMEPAPARRKTVEERLAQADRLLSQGQQGSALWQYMQAHEADPKLAAPRARIGFLEVSRDPERAEAIFAEIVHDHPESAEAHAGLGLARFAQSRLEPARESLERAVELDPDSAQAAYWLAVVYDLLERPQDARRLTERAYALSPRDPQIVNSLGVAYLVAGEFARAEESFRGAILLEPDDPALHNNLGLAIGRQRRYRAALDEFLRAGTEQAAYNNLGYVHYLNGEPEKAIEHYEHSLQIGGGDRLTVVKNLRAAQAALPPPASPR